MDQTQNRIKLCEQADRGFAKPATGEICSVDLKTYANLAGAQPELHQE